MERESIRPEATQRADAYDDPRLNEWRDDRFGLFIHWGLYAIPAGTWKGKKIPGIGEQIMKLARIPVAQYEQLAVQFNPAEFDADAWVKLAKAAGQRYIVITSKHHDGFCMYHSRVTDFNVVDATPFDRDPIAELAEACQHHGVKLGFYYSHTRDWHHPDGSRNDWGEGAEEKNLDAYVETFVKPQVYELLMRYGPVALIWFDTPGPMTEAQSRSLVDLVHDLQPDCLVNGRVGNGMGDYSSAGDNKIPPAAVHTDFETPATINDTWGFKDYDHNWKSIEDMVRKLVDITSKGGNYLLNVGPTAEGVIPKACVARLLGIGAWLDTNGESVYGTRPGPIQGLDWCRSTVKGDTLYLHAFDWPDGGTITLPHEFRDIRRAYLLGDPAMEPLPLEATDDAITIQGPAQAIDPIDTVLVLERS